MLTLVIILAIFFGVGAFLIIKKPIASEVKTTSEDEKSATWMDLGGDPNADKYTSQVDESIRENHEKATKRKKK